MLRITFSCIFLFLVGTEGFWSFSKTCPDVDAVPGNFTLNEYMGKWYLVRATTSLLIKHGRCITQEYTAINETNNFNIAMEKVSKLFGLVTTKGLAQMDPNVVGKFQTILRNPWINMKMPYWILDTDYTGYAVVWSCRKEGLFAIRHAWILTRDPQPSDEILDKAENVFEEKSIVAKLRDIKQTDCDS